MGKTPPPPDVDENPVWSAEDFARARPAEGLHPQRVLAALVRKPGRPVGTVRSERQQVSLRLPRDVIDHFKASGPGWQTRAVAVLEREARKKR